MTKNGLLKQMALVLLFSSTLLVTALLSNGFAYNWCTDPDVEGCWIYDTDSVADSSANGVDGSKVGTVTFGSSTPDPPAAYSEGWMDFQGSDDYINFNDVPAISDSAQLTYVSWVYLDVLTGDKIILANVNAAGPGMEYWNDQSGFNSGRSNIYSIRVEESAGAGASSQQLEGDDGDALQETWTHVAATADAASATGLRLYVNGVEAGASPADISSLGDLGNSNSDFRSGIKDSNDRDMDGKMTQQAVFSTVLSITEINDIMDNGLLQPVAPSDNVKIFSGSGAFKVYEGSGTLRVYQ